MTEVNLAQVQAHLQAIAFVAKEVNVPVEKLLDALQKLSSSTNSSLVLVPREGVVNVT